MSKLHTFVNPDEKLFCSTFIITAHQKEQLSSLARDVSFRLCKFANKATSRRKSILEQHLNALMECSACVKVGKTLRADFLRGKGLPSASYFKQSSRAKSIHCEDGAARYFPIRNAASALWEINSEGWQWVRMLTDQGESVCTNGV